MKWTALLGFVPLIQRGFERLAERRRIKRIAKKYDAIVKALDAAELSAAGVARRLRTSPADAEVWLARAEAAGVVTSRRAAQSSWRLYRVAD